ncbi:DUF1801 domain-containing protein [Marilutibacter aestuarii]|uniref:DUF1801 domain-containing protein n=1 Tax=Marilutibacter aestuarii TaxID=1706195 RepID=A0A507ZTS5_9GAMM|nr:DUF1801 domain-containing protein [Lysobacter aestuarii]TQD39913.1 DUF1801 domain-containing protein [Lysobacter aestuarii]
MSQTHPADPEVAAFLRDLDHPRKDVVLALRGLVLDANPAIGEAIKWNAPSFHTREHFATMHLRSPHAVQLVLHMGAKKRQMPENAIDDPAGLLAWRGADRAIVALPDLAALEGDRGALTAIIQQWIVQL